MIPQQPLSVRLARIAEEERRLAEELRYAEQLKEELKTNPALRRKMHLKAHQELEIQRDFVFQQMEDSEQHRIYGLRSLSQQIAAHKLFWKWREQALLELRHLRQTERLDKDDSWIPTMLDNPADTATILPITHPGRFRSATATTCARTTPMVPLRSGGNGFVCRLPPREAIFHPRDVAEWVQTRTLPLAKRERGI